LYPEFFNTPLDLTGQEKTAARAAGTAFRLLLEYELPVSGCIAPRKANPYLSNLRALCTILFYVAQNNCYFIITAPS